MLLACADLTEHEFQIIHSRVCSNMASEDDKWLHYRHLYKAKWGIDLISQAFVDEHGTNPGSAKVHLCMRLLFPHMRVIDCGSVRHSTTLLQVALISQVLAAMGWAHPFDVDKSVLADEAKAALLQTDMFKNYANNIRLFDPRAKPTKTWNNKAIVDSISLVLGACGMGVESTASRTQLDGQRVRTYQYNIAKDSAEMMASLVNLKRRNATSLTCAQPGALTFLEATGFGQYSDLVVTSNGSGYLFEDDE